MTDFVWERIKQLLPDEGTFEIISRILGPVARSPVLLLQL